MTTQETITKYKISVEYLAENKMPYWALQTLAREIKQREGWPTSTDSYRMARAVLNTILTPSQQNLMGPAS